MNEQILDPVKKGRTYMNNRRNINVVIIDSGINSQIADLNDYVQASTGFEVNHNGYIVEKPDKLVENQHGTAISLIIKYVCSHVKFISINILNKKLKTDNRILVYALRRVLELQPDIIHLSLGTTRWTNKFSIERIIKEAIRKKIVIVASAHNSGRISYPAHSKRVIGVKGDFDVPVWGYYYRRKYFFAPLGVQNIPGIEELEGDTLMGTSMSSAYITGHVANIMRETGQKDFSVIHRMLITNSKKQCA